jgi:electron transfer flavoprotein alpha subunit
VAKPLASEAVLWLPGTNADEASKLSLPANVTEVVCAPAAERYHLDIMNWLAMHMQNTRPTVLLADCGCTCSQAALSYAVNHDLPCINGVLIKDGSIVKKVCGSHLDWHVPLTSERQVWIVSPTVTESAADTASHVPISVLQHINPTNTRILSSERIPETPLPDARLLLVGGRGMGSAYGIAKLQKLSAILGGQTGVTRAVALNGWASMNFCVGQSGVITYPDICVTFGVSGAAAFMIGVEKARLLIAINTDKDAPIFRYAHYGIVTDANSIADSLLQKTELCPTPIHTSES